MINRFILYSFFLIVFIQGKAFGQQRVYATIAPSTRFAAYNISTNVEFPAQGNTVASVSTPNEASNSDDIPAVMAVKTKNPFYGEAGLQLKYNDNLISGTTIFIRISQIATTSGLNLDQVDMAGLIGTVIKAEAYSGATSTSDGVKVSAQDVKTELVTDKTNIYLAVTVAAVYNSVRILFRYASQINGQNTGEHLFMSVYYGFYLATNPADCGLTWASNIGEVHGTGLSLRNGILAPENAIDTDSISYSTLQTNSVNGIDVSQTIFFTGLSTDLSQQIKLVLSVPSELLNLDLFNQITIQLYNGNIAVGSAVSLSSLVSGDILTRFSGDKRVSVLCTPTGNYDRLKIRVSSSASLFSTAVNVHYVSRTVSAPSFTQNQISYCQNNTGTLRIANPSSSLVYTWYDQNGNVIASNANQWAYTPTLTPGTYYFYLSAAKAGCEANLSGKVKAQITVHANPGSPTIQIQ